MNNKKFKLWNIRCMNKKMVYLEIYKKMCYTITKYKFDIDKKQIR